MRHHQSFVARGGLHTLLYGGIVDSRRYENIASFVNCRTMKQICRPAEQRDQKLADVKLGDDHEAA
jgi:hypothetical protein